MNAKRDSREPSSDRPFTWSELRDRSEVYDATAEVSAELASLWSDLSVPGDVTVETVEKGAGPDEAIAPHRPDWVGSALRPRGAERLTPPRLQLRGVPVDPLVIWGDEDRSVYNDTSFPWGCVCLVQGRGSAGSGVIVGPRHVLTASHVVDWGGPAETIDVHRVGGMVQATARTVNRFFFTKIVGEPGYTTVDEDYAVLVTDQRIGDRFGSLGVRTYDSGWDDEPFWWNIGYAGDIASGTTPYSQRDRALDEDEWDYGSGRAMTTTADLMRRQSGSPMFGFWDDGPYVVAVASAVGNIVLSGTENWCSGGSDLTRLVREARSMKP